MTPSSHGEGNGKLKEMNCGSSQRAMREGGKLQITSLAREKSFKLLKEDGPYVISYKSKTRTENG